MGIIMKSLTGCRALNRRRTEMHKLTNKQYEAYMKMLRDKEEGRLLTPDGLRLICSANEYDPEKIGLHMLTVLANWNKVDVTE